MSLFLNGVGSVNGAMINDTRTARHWRCAHTTLVSIKYLLYYVNTLFARQRYWIVLKNSIGWGYQKNSMLCQPKKDDFEEIYFNGSPSLKLLWHKGYNSYRHKPICYALTLRSVVYSYFQIWLHRAVSLHSPNRFHFQWLCKKTIALFKFQTNSIFFNFRMNSCYHEIKLYNANHLSNYQLAKSNPLKRLLNEERSEKSFKSLGDHLHSFITWHYRFDSTRTR